jgi:predicted dehydrogenase
MIIGLGNAGLDHARAIESIPDYAMVVAGIDIAPARGLTFRDREVPVYQNAGEAYDAKVNPDVVVVAAPTRVHELACADVAKYFPGTAVLVEKPAADNLTDALRVIGNAACSKCVDVAYHMAYSPEVSWAVEQARSGADALGSPVSIEAWATDPYQANHESARATFGSSWIDSGINALSVIERFATLVERASYRTIGRDQESTSEARFVCMSAGRSFPATVLTSWQSSGPSRSTRIRYESGIELVMDHHAVVGFLMKDGATIAFFGGDASIPRRESHYRALYRSWLVDGQQMFSAETSARLHSLLLAG